MNHEALKLACLACNGMGFIDGVGAKCRRCDGRGVTLATTQPAQPAPVQPVVWTPGPNLFKDWCSQYFGPDADDAYIADAIFNLPSMAQRFATTPPAQPAPVQELHKENPYYPATYIGEGWQDGFDGKALASTLEPYMRGYAEGKADARAIEQTHGITPPSASPNPPRSD
jgi:hypothetical protein